MSGLLRSSSGSRAATFNGKPGQFGDLDRPVQPLLRRDPAQECQILTLTRVEHQTVNVHSIVHGSEPVQVGQWASLAMRDRDHPGLWEAGVQAGKVR
jgi:hypothetical protein